MLNHVTLEVPRGIMDAEVEWWQDLLGFNEEAPYSDKYGARWIYRWDTDGSRLSQETYGRREQIHLFPVPHEARSGLDEALESAIIPKYGHLAFVVGSMLEPVVTIAASYAEQYGRPAPVEGTRYWGTRRWMVTSPAGHRVELMETGPLPADERDNISSQGSLT
jgi:catechol 2,3-dioxygenase-like lactoylglutathione lyase family enzyme